MKKVTVTAGWEDSNGEWRGNADECLRLNMAKPNIPALINYMRTNFTRTPPEDTLRLVIDIR